MTVLSVRRYGDRRASQFIVIKMLAQQVEHFLGFLYDFRYLKHDCVLLKDMFDVSHSLPTTGEKASSKGEHKENLQQTFHLLLWVFFFIRTIFYQK